MKRSYMQKSTALRTFDLRNRLIQLTKMRKRKTVADLGKVTGQCNQDLLWTYQFLDV